MDPTAIIASPSQRGGSTRFVGLGYADSIIIDVALALLATVARLLTRAKGGLRIHSARTNRSFGIEFPRGSAGYPRGNSGYGTWTWFFFLLCHREVGNALRSNEGLSE